ncbi:MAG TPA: ABC transporter substrate-binding protein [Burkholderiales bacterium]|nr:ABC transporter substrate-binding protein [Burkholderiales bacterium]
MPVVGVLVTHAAVDEPIFDSLRAGLREYGYEEGRNIKLEIVTAEGHLDRLPGIAQELVRQSVDVIIAPNEVSSRTAQQATKTIPIVSIGFGNDPVASGVVDSLGRPGGNVTGIYGLWVELDGKRLEVLKETLPGVSRVAVFRTPGFDRQVGELRRAAQSLGMRLELVDVGGPSDFETAFKVAKRKKVAAVMLESSPIFYLHRARVAALALHARLPTISGFNQSVEAGGFMSYGADVADTFRRTAYYVDRLLKGAKPSELPVEQVSKFKLAVNLKTANALGITIPEPILLRADEVIR